MTKGDLLSMLGNDAFTFVGFLLTEDSAAKVINKMFEITPASGIELDDPIIVSMIGQLVTGGVISQATKDRIDAWVTAKLAETVIAEPVQIRTYTVPANVGNVNQWLNDNSNVPYEVHIQTDGSCIVYTSATLPSPAQEVA
jgi:hypothetical protein